MQSTLVLILFLVVVFIPGVVLLALGSVGYGRGRQDDDEQPRPDKPYAQPGELPELLRRPLRAGH
jgi:hypothetical protein